MKKGLLLFLILMTGNVISMAQNDSSNNHPFPFWEEGVWVHHLTIYNGDTIKDQSIYIVEKENEFTFHEKWLLDIGEGQLLPCRVTKAFDKETSHWSMFYTDGSYAQVWDMNPTDKGFHFQKSFNFSGNKFLSRQRWQKLKNDRIIRTIERSIDQGKTWTTRYYIELKKKDVK